MSTIGRFTQARPGCPGPGGHLNLTGTVISLTIHVNELKLSMCILMNRPESVSQIFYLGPKSILTAFLFDLH